MSPIGLFLWVLGLLCDCVYPFVLWHVKKTEIVLGDGRKIARDSAREHSGMKVQ